MSMERDENGPSRMAAAIETRGLCKTFKTDIRAVQSLDIIVKGYLVAPIPRIRLYPMASLPGWMKVGAMANPTSYLVDGIRQTVLAGSGELSLWPCLVVTTAFAGLGLLAASRAFAAKTAKS